MRVTQPAPARIKPLCGCTKRGQPRLQATRAGPAAQGPGARCYCLGECQCHDGIAVPIYAKVRA